MTTSTNVSAYFCACFLYRECDCDAHHHAIVDCNALYAVVNRVKFTVYAYVDDVRTRAALNLVT